jgi:hypothetical protein
LGQGLGVGIHHANLAHIQGFGRQEAMVHGHAHLADHLQRSGRQQVVDLGDGAFKGVFHRHDPDIQMALLHPFEHVDEFHARDEGPAGHEAAAGHLPVSARFALKGHQLAILLLQAPALLDDGAQQLARKGTLHEVQVHPFSPGQHDLLTPGIHHLDLELFGVNGQAHALLQQHQQLAVDLVDSATDLFQVHCTELLCCILCN